MFSLIVIAVVCFLATPIAVKVYTWSVSYKQNLIEEKKQALLIEARDIYADMIKNNNLDEIKQAIHKEVFFKAYVLITEILATDYKAVRATLQRIDFKNPEKDKKYALIKDDGLYQHNPNGHQTYKGTDLINKVEFANDEKTKMFWNAFFVHVMEKIASEQKKEEEEKQRLAEIERQKIEATYF